MSANQQEQLPPKKPLHSRVLFTCNSKISVEEVSFFNLLNSKLREEGIEFVFLSPIMYPDMGPYLLWRAEWGRNKKSYDFKTLPVQRAMRLIDVNKWLLRVGYFRGQHDGNKDCMPILEQVAGESLALLERTQPGMLVAWNSLYPVPGVMYDIAKELGIPAVDSERGMLPGTLQWDPELRGLHNSLCDLCWDDIISQKKHEEWAQVGEEFLKSAYRGDFCRYPVEKNSVLENITADRRLSLRPKVLVAGAFDFACGITLADPARGEILPNFESGFDLAKQVAQSHAGITVFKPHPAMLGSLRYCDARGAKNLLLGSGHPRPYLDWADVVVTYGSLEYDALALGKPVVLAGKSSLFGMGICYEALSEGCLEEAIEKALNREQIDIRRNRFSTLVGYLVERRLFRFDNEEERQRSAARWCDAIDKTIIVSPPRESLDSIKVDLELIPTPLERLTDIVKRIAPSTGRKALRIWTALKS